MDALSRRGFLAGALGSVAAARGRDEHPGSERSAAHPAPREGRGFPGPLCLFSKHLPGLDARELARAVKPMGFTGVDLTVRPGGHVAPERAATDLAPFVRTLRDEGLAVPLITTGLTSASDPTARPLLEAAGRLGIPLFKPGYYRYAFADVRKERAEAAAALRDLAGLGGRRGVALAFHNHAGFVGGPIWDIAPVVESLDPREVGYYFDVRHAVVEGGDAGWRVALSLVAPRLKMAAIKDFFWDKGPSGWRQRHCPLGEGMVDWKAFFGDLAKLSFRGPLSLHLEYEMAGATARQREEATLLAAARDLAFLKARLGEANPPAGAVVS